MLPKKSLEQRSNGRVFSLIRTKMLGLHKHSRKLVKPERVRSNLMHRTHSATNLASYPFQKKTENHKKEIPLVLKLELHLWLYSLLQSSAIVPSTRGTPHRKLFLASHLLYWQILILTCKKGAG